MHSPTQLTFPAHLKSCKRKVSCHRRHLSVMWIVVCVMIIDKHEIVFLSFFIFVYITDTTTQNNSSLIFV